jgi:hypothetical protein
MLPSLLLPLCCHFLRRSKPCCHFLGIRQPPVPTNEKTPGLPRQAGDQGLGDITQTPRKIGVRVDGPLAAWKAFSSAPITASKAAGPWLYPIVIPP